MKNINYILILFLICSCTKEIDIEIPNNGTQFVVNGYIENNRVAKILITRSLPYFDPISDNSIGESLVNDAIVTISNSIGESELLTPTYSPWFTNLTDTWYYNYATSSMKGVEGVTYTITIEKDDTLVSTITTIPKLAPLTKDSLRFLYRADDSTYCYLLGHWEDPDTIGNCIRAFTQTKPIWSSTFDYIHPDGWDDLFISMLEGDGNYNDEYVNGWSFSFPMYKGRGFWQEWGEQETNGENDEVDGSTGATTGFWNIGDSISLKWSSWDRKSWDFWRSLEFNNPAGPFGAPSQANSNVDGGLGVFSGTSSEYIYLQADPELENQLSN
ncbi:MAG: hypothetical protein CMP56_04435 [Flavobacteriales bacterium]|nr:hypothetical protein [Flavobacteriales bacterium]